MDFKEPLPRKKTIPVSARRANPSDSDFPECSRYQRDQSLAYRSGVKLPNHSNKGGRHSTTRTDNLANQIDQWHWDSSWKMPTNSTDLKSSQPKPDPRPNLAVGDESAPGLWFCPVQAVSKYPYKYMDKSYLTTVSKHYFAGGKFWEQSWDIYYVLPRTDNTDNPIFLIPATQVDEFINTIRIELQVGICFPKNSAESGFAIQFADDGTPRPRYLGRVKCRADFENIKDIMLNTPSQPQLPATPNSSIASKEALAAFREKLDLAVEAGKVKSKTVKEKKKSDRFERQRGYIRQIRRTQCYIGLRQQTGINQESYRHIHPLQGGFQRETIDEFQEKCLVGGQVFILNKFQFYIPANFVVFVSVDVEAYERNNNLITEIGISTLDTSDLLSTPPGDGCSNWNSKIQSRHFRIKEHSHLRNGDFVDDRADNFEFGKSEWIDLIDAPRVIASCFRPPYSDTTMAPDESDNSLQLPLVLVGHDVKNDIAFLRRLGYDVSTNEHITEVLDTALMFRALKRESNSRSLGTILYDLGLVGWNLHNAGNDAAYTLQAMLSIAVQDLTGQHRSRAEAEKQERFEALVVEAGQRVQEEQEGWSSIDDGDYGGPPPAVSL